MSFPWYLFSLCCLPSDPLPRPVGQQQLLQRQQSVPQSAVSGAGGPAGVPQQLLLRQQSEPAVPQPGQRVVQVGGQQVVLPQGQPLTAEMRQHILVRSRAVRRVQLLVLFGRWEEASQRLERIGLSEGEEACLSFA